MRIVVFGASGQTGRLVVKSLLDRGDEVVGFVRDRQKLALSHPALSMIVGTANDAEAMARAVDGADCVISTVASGNGILTELAANLVPLLVAKGPRRIVTLGGAATELPGDPKTLKRRFFLMMMGLGGRHFTDDVRAHWQALQAAGLDCTLIRPPRLTDGPATGHIRHGSDLTLGMMDKISRADLAGFIVDCAVNACHVGEAPFVAAS